MAAKIICWWRNRNGPSEKGNDSLKERNEVLAFAFYLLATAMLAVTLYSTESRQVKREPISDRRA